MSLWVEPPELVDTTSGESLLRFRDESWSLDGAEWQSDFVVAFQLRKYPGDENQCAITVIAHCGYRVAEIDGSAPMSFQEVERFLDERYSRRD